MYRILKRDELLRQNRNDLFLRMDNVLSFLHPDLHWSEEQLEQLWAVLTRVTKTSSRMIKSRCLNFDNHMDRMAFYLLQSTNWKLVQKGREKYPEIHQTLERLSKSKDEDLLGNPLYFRMRWLLKQSAV